MPTLPALVITSIGLEVAMVSMPESVVVPKIKSVLTIKEPVVEALPDLSMTNFPVPAIRAPFSMVVVPLTDKV